MADSANQTIHSLRSLARVVTRHRSLVYEMSRREITERYTGQFMGAFWVFFHPLFLICLYLVIFDYVLKVGSNRSVDTDIEYSVYLLAGLIPWMSFQEALTKGCTAVTSHAALVKQVVFPLEVLPFKAISTAVVNQCIASVLMLGYVVWIEHTITWMLLLLPFVIFVQFVGMLGASYLLAAITSYVRDVKDLVQLVSMAGLYLVPVFYLPSWVPEVLMPVVELNPFSHMVWCYQDIVSAGFIQHPTSWIVFPVFCFLLLLIGARVFQALKPVFGNVL